MFLLLIHCLNLTPCFESTKGFWWMYKGKEERLLFCYERYLVLVLHNVKFEFLYVVCPFFMVTETFPCSIIN